MLAGTADIIASLPSHRASGGPAGNRNEPLPRLKRRSQPRANIAKKVSPAAPFESHPRAEREPPFELRRKCVYMGTYTTTTRAA